MMPGAPHGPGRPGLFLLLAIASSWMAWIAADEARGHLQHGLVTTLNIAGFLLVGATALVMLHRERDRRATQEFWRSLLDVRRPSAAGWLLAILLFPAVAYAAAWLDAHGIGQSPQLAAPFQAGARRPADILKAFGFAWIVGPALEEAGWRGYALPALQRRYRPLVAASLLGILHALWHLPLILAPEGYLHELGIMTPAFWRFMADILLFDLIVAAVFNATRSSTLAAIAMHGSFNAAGALWILAPTGAALRDAGIAAVAIAIVIGTRGRMFLEIERRGGG